MRASPYPAASLGRAGGGVSLKKDLVMPEMYFPVVPVDLTDHAPVCVPLSELIPGDPQAHELVVPLFGPDDAQRIINLLSYPTETTVSASTYIAALAGKPYVIVLYPESLAFPTSSYRPVSALTAVS